MRSANSADRLWVNEGVSAREFDGEWVVLDLRGGNYFGLDDLGGRIWHYVSEGMSVAELVALLVPHYDVDPPILLRDVLGLIDKMIELELVSFRE